MLLTYIANLPTTAPGHIKAIDQLTTTYKNNITSLNVAWGINIASFEGLASVTFTLWEWGTTSRQKDESDFLFTVASQYFQVCRDAIKAEDPHHMYLGEKLAGPPPSQQTSLLQAAALYSDAVAIDWYVAEVDMSVITNLYDIVLLPIIIGEFSFKAMDSGLPNTAGAAVPVATQQDRATGLKYYVMNVTRHPAVVGFDWFEYIDEPALVCRV